ncbi:hypothetical protein [Thermococcus nautili]|uniref:hypothetical protein n=1 Tax=Thermococcus nautili TaxID=195522 RepID=UPI002552FACF|nr:hypothetical protein [Thermococcus nautili]
MFSMKKFALALLLVAVVLLASGCTGSGGTSSSETPETTSHSQGWESSTSQTPTSSQGTTETPSETHSTSSPTPSQTETPTSTTPTPSEELYWTNPWEYSPIDVNGEKYVITHYVVLYKVRPNETSPLYEYRIEKTERKANITVYGMDFSGSKVEVGTFEVYEYETVITPVKAAAMEEPLTIKVWYTTRASDAFIYPWDMGWASANYGENQVVGFEMDYQGRQLLYTNPMAVGKSAIPYMGGDQNIMDELNTDLMNLYYGWFAVLHVGIWADWSGRNLLVPQSGTWSDFFGHAWSWETKPDGTVEFSGIKFRVVEGTWSYTGVEGVSMTGKARVAPKIFIPLEVDGHFTSIDENGNPLTIYGYFKVEELDLAKAS